jgi:dihydrofolate reductase
MRKVKLQMQLSLDGYAAAADGRLDWLIWDFGKDWIWDEELRTYHTGLTASIDCVLLSRKMAEGGFIGHWAEMAENTGHPQAVFAGNIARAKKVVFTKTLDRSVWENTSLAKGDLAAEVNALKMQAGKDIIVYGGASFVSALIQARLIDEYHLVINPTVLGTGMAIFTEAGRMGLTLTDARPYACGVAVLIYHNKNIV